VKELHEPPVDVARRDCEDRANEDRPASAADERGDRSGQRADGDAEGRIGRLFAVGGGLGELNLANLLLPVTSVGTFLLLGLVPPGLLLGRLLRLHKWGPKVFSG